MSQTAVADKPSRAYRGMLGDGPQHSVSGIAGDTIIYGNGVGIKAAAGVSEMPKEAFGYAAGDLFYGLAVPDTTVEMVDGQEYGQYVETDTLRILKKGTMWVPTGDAVDNLSKSVFIRNANAGGSPPAEQLGAFRATTATDYIDLGAIADIKWVAGATINGQTYGLLSINEG